MHPNRLFRAETDGLLERAAAIGFAHVFANTAAGPMVVHAPVTLHGERLRFHIARANRIADHLDGADLLLSIVGEHGYISPNWYTGPRDRQVPTWNYTAIEIEGRAAALGDEGLTEQLDALAAAHEPRVNPADPWTRAKTDPDFYARLLRAVRGFELAVTATRGTIKLGQHKSAIDRAGVKAGLIASGNGALAAVSP